MKNTFKYKITESQLEMIKKTMSENKTTIMEGPPSGFLKFLGLSSDEMVINLEKKIGSTEGTLLKNLDELITIAKKNMNSNGDLLGVGNKIIVSNDDLKKLLGPKGLLSGDPSKIKTIIDKTKKIDLKDGHNMGELLDQYLKTSKVKLGAVAKEQMKKKFIEKYRSVPMLKWDESIVDEAEKLLDNGVMTKDEMIKLLEPKAPGFSELWDQLVLYKEFKNQGNFKSFNEFLKSKNYELPKWYKKGGVKTADFLFEPWRKMTEGGMKNFGRGFMQLFLRYGVITGIPINATLLAYYNINKGLSNLEYYSNKSDEDFRNDISNFLSDNTSEIIIGNVPIKMYNANDLSHNKYLKGYTEFESDFANKTVIFPKGISINGKIYDIFTFDGTNLKAVSETSSNTSKSGVEEFKSFLNKNSDWKDVDLNDYNITSISKNTFRIEEKGGDNYWDYKLTDKGYVLQ